MSKYIETQTRKVLSSNGGVGSIIETIKGSFLIEDFDKWPFIKNIINRKLEIDKFKVTDNRLLKRLQNEKGFPQLKEFLKVPPNYSHYIVKTEPENKDEVISCNYFPKWFYCTKCDRFNSVNKWWEAWKRVKPNSKTEEFIPPMCVYCYTQAIEKKSKIKYYNLEQVRFIMTSSTGFISDVPWDRWVNSQVIIDDDDLLESGSIKLDFEKLCCENQNLFYKKSTKFSDFSGIRIECHFCGKKNSLAGLFSLKLPINDKNNILKKVVIRTSNSVYYPITINSIYLPTKREIDLNDERKIKKWQENGKNTNFMLEALVNDDGNEKYTKDEIEKFIKGEINGEFEPEIEYRLKEYNFILSKNSYSDNELIFEQKENLVKDLEKYNISNLSSIKKLKITNVQTGYTRQEPIDRDTFLSGDVESNIKVKVNYTSSFGKNTEYLPAIESFGEGIFLSLEKSKVDSWIINSLKNENFENRMNKLFTNCQKHEYLSVNKKFKSLTHLIKFVLIHTLSHILIKEFEFLCGYPSTSLNERLFIDEDNMNGLLIYTVAGSEGSYGGLVSQTGNKKFIRIFESAIRRSIDCASDPICYHTEDGQGIGGLNMASCYSCCLIPENACEEFNSFLDRAVLIDKDFGFFNIP